MTAEQHLQAALSALGFDVEPACAGTAERVAELLRSFRPGGAAPELTLFPAPSTAGTLGGDPVILRGLPFHSLCAHHLLPFFGTIDLAYCPRAFIAGLGSIPRLLRFHARQPQLQEQLTAQLADALHQGLDAPVVVRIRARQMCMELRGAESPGEIETWASRGVGAVALQAQL